MSMANGWATPLTREIVAERGLVLRVPCAARLPSIRGACQINSSSDVIQASKREKRCVSHIADCAQHPNVQGQPPRKEDRHVSFEAEDLWRLLYRLSHFEPLKFASYPEEEASCRERQRLSSGAPVSLGAADSAGGYIGEIRKQQFDKALSSCYGRTNWAHAA